MHVLHEAEEVQPRVADGLQEASARALALRDLGGVAGDAVVCQLAFLGGEPAGREGEVREKPQPDAGNAEGHGTFDNEQPISVLDTASCLRTGVMLTISIQQGRARRPTWQRLPQR